MSVLTALRSEGCIMVKVLMSSGDPEVDRLVWFRWIHGREVPAEADTAALGPPLLSD